MQTLIYMISVTRYQGSADFELAKLTFRSAVPTTRSAVAVGFRKTSTCPVCTSSKKNFFNLHFSKLFFLINLFYLFLVGKMVEKLWRICFFKVSIVMRAEPKHSSEYLFTKNPENDYDGAEFIQTRQITVRRNWIFYKFLNQVFHDTWVHKK